MFWPVFFQTPSPKVGLFFVGQFNALKCEPKPAQAGGIPIWVGGHTPQAIRRAAHLGNGWQPIVQRPPADLPPSELRDKIRILNEQAEAVGRDPSTLTMALGATVQFSDGGGSGIFSGSSQQIIDGIGQYQEAGVQDSRFDFPAPSLEGVLSRMERFAAEVHPHVG